MKEHETNGTIENWFIDQATKKEFIIYGCLFDDPNNRWFNGQFIHTSGIKNRKCAQGDIVETRNSKYLLGVPLNGN